MFHFIKFPGIRSLGLVFVCSLTAVSCDGLSRPSDQEAALNSNLLQFETLEGPSLQLLRPPSNGDEPAAVAPVSLFIWETRPGFDDPAETRPIIVSTKRFRGDWEAALNYIRSHPDAREWSDWIRYSLSEVWQSPELGAGGYVFAVQARDEEGNVDPELDFSWNARRILVDPGVGGPRLVVTNEYMDPVVSTSTDNLPTVVDIPFGIPLDFCWTADASAYGGTVTAYRYGWDVLDLHDPDQWEIDFTPYDGSEICAPTRVFSFGTHEFAVEVVDNRDEHSRVFIRLNILPYMVTLDFMPGTCKDPINRNRNGIVKAAIPGTVAMDVRSIDPSSLVLYLYNYDERLSPVSVRVHDITSPVIPWEPCGCESRADGIDDLVMTFHASDVARLFAGMTAGQQLSLQVRGLFNDGRFLEGFDCVTIVGDGAVPANPVGAGNRGSHTSYSEGTTSTRSP